VNGFSLLKENIWKLREEKMPEGKQCVYKIVIVHRLTPKTNYTRLLEKGFRHSASKADITLYGNKEENISDLPNAKNVWSNNFYPFQVFRQTVGDRPDIVHIQYEFTTFGPFWTNLLFPLLLILMKIAGVKTVVTVHSVIPKEMVNKEFMQQLLPPIAKFGMGEILFKMFLAFLYRTMAISADRLVVHGGWYKKKMVSSYKAPSWKIHIISYGVDEKKFAEDALLKWWRKRIGEHRVILFFGNISPRKDMETLIRSLAIFLRNNQDYLLLIAGRELPYYQWYGERLKSITKELELSENVIFSGPISDEEIHVLYSISEFAVFPYLYGFEGPSGPLAFAIQHCVPIIGTGVGHLAEEICNMKEGILVPPKDIKALAEAMTKLANDRNLRENFSENLRRKMKGMLWRDVAEKTFQLYRELMEDSKNSRLRIISSIQGS